MGACGILPRAILTVPHLPDFHPDGHYNAGTSIKTACHRGEGQAGYFGSEGTDCDAPLSLANETFRWIERSLKDSIDFVVWTGDSVRHDYDDEVPRTEEEVFNLQRFITEGLINTFKDDNRSPSVPIIPTIGNNDVMPHNIFRDGPNKWTRKFLDAWNELIPESQRHSFVRGGWFTTEVIPNKLAVISLNTMYFFDSNSAVDGCEDKSEPGYEHMEWLRVQLKLLRDRQMKAILIGHVPPARSGSKRNWEETCWQKYSLWMSRYRDVVVGSLYGHMNIDHFMFQDSEDVKIADIEGDGSSFGAPEHLSNFSVQSRAGYLSSLREQWSEMPEPPTDVSDLSAEEWLAEDDLVRSQTSKKKMNRFLKKIGGHWVERYSVSCVSPSVVPDYFPSLRVFEYNISGLENATTWENDFSSGNPFSELSSHTDEEVEDSALVEPDWDQRAVIDKKKGKKKKKPKFKVPEPPSPLAPPGPAYSNQPLTWLSYTQYYANLTRINREVTMLQEQLEKDPASITNEDLEKALHDIFYYEVEYNTKNDDYYRLKDLTVRNFFKLATLIAKNRLDENDTLFAGNKDAPSPTVPIDERSIGEAQSAVNGSLPDLESSKKKKKKKYRNRIWRTFLDRAFVGFLDSDDLDDIDS